MPVVNTLSIICYSFLLYLSRQQVSVKYRKYLRLEIPKDITIDAMANVVIMRIKLSSMWDV